MGATCGTGVATLSEHLSSLSVFSGVRVARSLVFCVVFCRSLFVTFRLVFVLYVLPFAVSDYPFGIFNLFFLCIRHDEEIVIRMILVL